jgi:integrase
LADDDPDERAWIEQARVVFPPVVSAGLRRGEILGLRWRDVSLADPAGATLRVRGTWVRSQRDTPK